ncbi:MAG: amidohydrolase family protein [Frankiaceae bacterium]
MMRTVFTGGRIFDGTGLAPADIVIADGRIVEVGPGLDGDEAVDVTGCSVLPGLFDAHVHTVLRSISPYDNMQQPFSYQFFVAAQNLRTLLGLGITSVRDAGGADAGIKRALADKLLPGPRLQISVTMISQTGGHGDNCMASGLTGSVFSAPHPGRPDPVADGPEAMRRKARELIRAGADVLKVATSGGVLSPDTNPRHGHYRGDELAALVAEANAVEIPVMAHAQATEGIKEAVRAGVRSIEHGVFLDDETIDLMVARGTWLVPTLLAPQGVIEAVAAGIAISEGSKRKIREVAEAHIESFSRAVDAGVRVAMGTDAPVMPFGRNLEELSLMMEFSAMTPADAILAATASAADLFRVGDELGSLQPGKRADLVVITGNVLDLVRLNTRIDQVWQDGLRVV